MMHHFECLHTFSAALKKQKYYNWETVSSLFHAQVLSYKFSIAFVRFICCHSILYSHLVCRGTMLLTDSLSWGQGFTLSNNLTLTKVVWSEEGIYTDSYKIYQADLKKKQTLVNKNQYSLYLILTRSVICITKNLIGLWR